MALTTSLVFLTIICQVTSFAHGANEPHLSKQYCNGIFSDDETIEVDYSINVQNALYNLQSRSVTVYPPSAPSFLKVKKGRNASTRAYASYFCRSDISNDRCYDCLGSAHNVLYEDDEITGYDCFLYNVNLECMIHYANNTKYMVYRNGNVITGDAYGDDLSKNPRYNTTLSVTMGELIREAGHRNMTKKVKFTTKVVNVTGSMENIYILVQCTPDISAINCSTCLSGLLSSYPPKTIGGHALAANCLIKYDNKSFLTVANGSFMPSYVHVIMVMFLATYLTLAY